MEVNWSDVEKEAIEKLADEQEMTERSIIRQAVRLYQHVHMHGKAGLQMGFYDTEGKRVITGGPLAEMD